MALRQEWTIPYPAKVVAAKAKALAAPHRKNVTELVEKKRMLQNDLNKANVNASSLHHASERHQEMYAEVARIDNVLGEDTEIANELEFFARVLEDKDIMVDLHLDDIRFFGLAS